MNAARDSRSPVRPGIVWGSLLVLVVAATFAIYKTHHASSSSNPTVSNTFAASQQTTLPPPPNTTISAPPTTAVTQTTTFVEINHSVTLGDVAYDVDDMECHVTQVGTTYAGISAPQGAQWCLVKLSMTNVGSSPTYSPVGETALDPMGDKFSIDENAMLYVSESFGYDPINPGVTVENVIPFQLSMSDILVTLQLSSGSLGSADIPLT
jgi:hypothetical protein